MIRQLSRIIVVLVGLAGCTTIGSIPTERIAAAALQNANGFQVGTAVLTATGQKLTLNLVAAGLPAGGHGLHLHMTGSCDGPAFTSAGAHLNPSGHLHGTANPAGSHLGDLPNLTIDTRGSGALSMHLPGPRTELEATIFDGDGTAIVVHADPDDYKTDPTGKSGARIACGVLQRTSKR